MLQKLSHSLSLRLLAIFVLLAVIYSYGSIAAVRWVFSTDQLRELVNDHMELHIDYVKRDIGNPPNLVNALALTRKIPVDIRIIGEDVNWASVPEFPQLAALSFDGIDSVGDHSQPWLEGLDEVKFASTSSHKFLKIVQDDYSIIVSSPKMAEMPRNRSLLPIIITFGILTILGSYLAVRSLFKPIHSIREGADRIGRGNFDHRIARTRNDELGALSDDINAMASEVERMLDAKRQLLLGISHELRTPLSRMNLALEMMDENVENASELKEDVQEMESIISTLLEAERLNQTHASLTLTRVSGQELANNLLNEYFKRDKQRISIDAPVDYWLTVDEVRATLMLKNLVSNALRYIESDTGWVRVEFTNTSDSWIITVRDNGIGYPLDKVDRIGEPFFRVDSSRARESGVSGLGLYLTKLIAEAHGGSLNLDQNWSEGAAFVIEIPYEA